MMTDLLARLAAALADRYTLDRELGHGGMAVVFLAEDLKHHRRVALKVLPPELAQVLGAERFLREIEIAARLAHPHILPLHESGEAGGFLYYVMPYVEGESLRDRLNRETQLPLADALQITREVADALAYAHSLGVIHRDIKPENILLQAGHAVVSDFGIARAIDAAGRERLTESYRRAWAERFYQLEGLLDEMTGVVLGTPLYMSPEQALGQSKVDARSDIYALGCVLYEMLAGEPPFTGPTPQAILARKSAGAVPQLSLIRESVPLGVERAIGRALARVPADRFATATEFLAALSEASPPQPPPRVGRLRPRPAWLAALVVALAIAALAIGLATRRGAAVPRSVAVLYFDNLSPDTADAYLADGLTEEISSRLGDIGRLQVKSRNAVRRYRGASLSDLAGVARALGVGYLVEGSVRRAGDRVRTSVHLVDARTGFRVWGDDYDRATSDLLSLQENIAREVAVQIAGRLLPAEHAVLAARPTPHPEAYDHFLRGNYYLTQWTPGAVARGIEEHETAARLDPAFTSAIARAAYGYALYLEWGWAYPGVPPDSLLARGIAAAERALARDSTAADAWMAQGYMLVHRYPRTLDGVREAFERALSLDPRNAEAWHQYGWILFLQSEDSSAVAAFRKALGIEPERPATLLLIAAVHFGGRRFNEAARWLDSTLALEPSFDVAYAVRALVRLRTGDGRGAYADAQAALRLTGNPLFAEATLAVVQAGLGDTAAGRARVEPLAASALSGETVPVEGGSFVAEALTATGDHERALQVLERIRPRGANLFSRLRSPYFDPLRAYPRFQRILAEARPPEQAG
jgi:serine/threonine-protein kinase